MKGIKTTSKIKTAIVSLALAFALALGLSAGALPSAAARAETSDSGAISREHKEYSLQSVVGGAGETNLGTGVTRYFANGYINLTTTGGGVAGAHSFKISLESADFGEFKTIWINSKALSGNWGDVRMLVKFFDETDKEISWNAKKAEPNVAGNSNMSISYMYQSYGKGANTYAEYFRDNSYIKVKTGVDNWYGLKFQSEKGTFENIMGDSTATADLSRVSYVTLGFDSYETDVALDIGAIYGETFDGDWVRVFTPFKAELSDSATLTKPNQVYYAKSGEFATSATTSVTLHGGKYTITDQNDWRWVENITTNMPSDISEYNGISFKAYNPDENAKNFEWYFAKGGATWSNNAGGTSATFIPETGDTFKGDGRNIPAGFKGTVIMPLSTFKNKFGNGDTTFDVKSGVPTNFGAIIDQHSAYVGTVEISDLKLINDAETSFNEYRYVEDALGDTKYVNILRTEYDGDTFKPEILIEGQSVNGVSTEKEWNEYNALISDITTEEEYNKKYTLESSERHADSGTEWLLNYGDVRTSLRMKTTYKRVEYTIALDENGGGNVDDLTAVWGASVTLPTPVRAGYTFGGWFDKDDAEFENAVTITEMPVANRELKAKWTANADTEYTVKHILQNLDGTYPDTAEATETKTGTTDTDTAAAAKTFEGFTAPQEITQVNIEGDGSAAVEIKYTRNSYTVTFKSGEDVLSTSQVKFGASVTLPETDPTAPEHMEFKGWFAGESKIDGEYTMPANDVTATAKFEKIATTYTVKHILENLDGETFTEVTADEENKSANAGDETEAEAKTYEGFTAKTITQATVADDGSTVITVQYTRNSYNVTFKSGENVLSTSQVKFGANVTLPETDPTAPEGKEFKGWYAGESKIDAAYTMPASDVVVTAEFIDKMPENPDNTGDGDNTGDNTGVTDNTGDETKGNVGCGCGGKEFAGTLALLAIALSFVVIKKH